MAAALFLHRSGHDVTIFEQFEEPRPIGSGLLIQPSGQRVLTQLGLLESARDMGAPVTRLRGINASNGKRALDVEYRFLSDDCAAIGIHRASLFDILHDAVRAAHIPVITGHRLIGVEDDGAICHPLFADQATADAFDILIDATGARSGISGGESHILPFAALWTTVDMPAHSDIAIASLDQRYWKSSSMAGVMPIGVNPASGNPGAALFWSIKPGDMNALVERGIDSWRAEFLALWPEAHAFVDRITSFDQLTLAIYRHRTGTPVSSARVFHLGDAWHCTSPQLGQGANMALVDALALAEAIERGETLKDVAANYRHLRSDHVKLYQLRSWIFTPLYQSDSRLLPVIRDMVIHYLGRLPGIRSLTARVVSGDLGNPL